MNDDLELEIYSALIGLIDDHNLPSTKNPVTHYIDDVLAKYNLTPERAIHILIRKRGTHSQETFDNLTTQIINYLKELNNLKPEFKQNRITQLVVSVDKIEQSFRDKINLELQEINGTDKKIEYLKEKLTEYKTKIITPEVQSISGTHLQEIYPVKGALYTDKYILDLLDGLENQNKKTISKGSRIVKLNLSTSEKGVIKDIFHTLQNGKLIEGELKHFKQTLISGTTDCYVNWVGSVPSLNYFLKHLFKHKQQTVSWIWGIKVFKLNKNITPQTLATTYGASAPNKETIDTAINHFKDAQQRNSSTKH